LENTTASTLTGVLNVSLVGKMNTVLCSVTNATIECAPGELRSYALTATPTNYEYGVECVATVTDPGSGISSTQKDYFAVSDDPLKIGCMAFTYPRYDYSRYALVTEFLFWQPDYFSNLNPTQDAWWDASSTIYWQRSAMKANIAKHQNRGRLVMSYAWQFCATSGIEEYLRTNPDAAVFTGIGPLVVIGNNANFAYKPPEERYNQYAQAVSTLNDNTLNHFIKQVVDSARDFGWDGIRFDAALTRPCLNALEGRCLDGEWESRGGDNDAYSAGALRTLVQQTNQQLGRKFYFGFNSEMGPRMRTPRAIAEFVRNGAQIQWESLHSAYDSSLFNNWNSFAKRMVKESDYARKIGGSISSWAINPGAYVNGVYQRKAEDVHYDMILNAVAGSLKSGLEVYDNPFSDDYMRFQLRYSEYIYAHELVRQTSPSFVTVTAPGTVWWNDYVYVQDLGAGKKRYVIHLVNPPASPVVSGPVSPSAPLGADYGPPAPLNNIGVTVTLPGGTSSAKVYYLRPENMDATTLSGTLGGGNLSVTVPILNRWGILVLETP
jgi:hypothetical protein